MKAQPFVKWAGGKTRIISHILAAIPAPERYENYYEPFLGGGSVFFALSHRAYKKYFLSDKCDDLIVAFNVIKHDVMALMKLLDRYKFLHTVEFYYSVRDANPLYMTPVERAARFIYLNKTCFNGLYRVNSKGAFNTPMNKQNTDPTLYNKDNLIKVHSLLDSYYTDIHAFGYEIIHPSLNDVVYCDPPYDEKYDSYTAVGFGKDQQIKLRDQALAWSDAGARVIISNSDTPFIREIYKDFCVKSIVAPRSIDRSKNATNKANEVIITI